MAETAGENILIFKTPDDDWGEFSNQYLAPFNYMGIRFETVEQFLYYMKAVFGRSKATAEKILSCGGDSSALSKTSKKQRILENNSWEAVRPQIMRLGMRQKFLQNPDLRKKLLSTGFRLLVEVPKEGLLGRLLPGSEDWVRDPGKWKNKNQTGKALMQVRSDLRSAERLVGPAEAYEFPEEPFILQTPLGQMTLQEIARLPGAKESVYAYAETAQQYLQLRIATADDFINRNKISLVTMERAIARNSADVALALSRADARAVEMENAEAVKEEAGTGAEETAVQTDTVSEEGIAADPAAALEGTAEEKAENTPDMEFGTGTEPELSFGTQPEPQPEVQPEVQPEPVPETPEENLPDDIPAEGFYELLYDLDEMMKLGII